jgi:hypothetical protein
MLLVSEQACDYIQNGMNQAPFEVFGPAFYLDIIVP